MNSLLCPCDKCIHWEKYEECKICNAENICSNEEDMDENDKENIYKTDENKTILLKRNKSFSMRLYFRCKKINKIPIALKHCTTAHIAIMQLKEHLI